MPTGIGFSWRLIEWNGPKVKEKAAAVAAGALKAGATHTLEGAESTVHVITGTLQRSLHVTSNPNEGDRTAEAEVNDLSAGPIPEPAKARGELSLWVIASTFYAIYEELLHPYLWPALQRTMSARIVESYIKAHQL